MITYIIQISLIWIALYLVYTSMLYKETFFKTNRIYLLVSLLAGILVPILVPMIESIPPLPPVGTYISELNAVIISASDRPAENWFKQPSNIVWLVYLLGVGVMSLKLISGLLYLWKLYNKSEISQQEGYSLVKTKAKHQPFSFFNLVFVTDQSTDQPYFQEIILLEIVHIRQRHSLDIIFVEILHIIFWFNPILLWYKRSLRASHEFMADRSLTRTISKDKYSLLLLGYTSAGDGVAFVNPFFNSLIKKRIQMMYSKNSETSALIKYFIALPIVTVMVMAFSTYKINGQTVLNAATHELVESTEKLVALSPIGSITETKLDQLSPKEANTTVLTPIKGTLNDSFPTDVLFILDGVIQPGNPNINADDVVSINVLKGEPALSKYGPKAKNGVVEIISKRQAKVELTGPDVPARFPGNTPEESQKKFFEYLASSIKYPESARKYGVEGKVILKYFVDAKGDISDVEVLKGISPDCDAEAKRVLDQMVKSQGNWIPAMKDGQPVPSAMHLPIKFMLTPLEDATKIQVDNLTVSYYPNPATNYIMVDMKGDLKTVATIQLRDMSGKVVKQLATQSQGLQEINTNDLPSGEYILYVTKDKMIKTEKVVIVR